MSMSRILCDRCGFAQMNCQCKEQSNHSQEHCDKWAFHFITAVPFFDDTEPCTCLAENDKIINRTQDMIDNLPKDFDPFS